MELPVLALFNTVYVDMRFATACDALSTPLRYPFPAREATFKSASAHTSLPVAIDTSSGVKADCREVDKVFSRSVESSCSPDAITKALHSEVLIRGKARQSEISDVTLKWWS